MYIRVQNIFELTVTTAFLWSCLCHTCASAKKNILASNDRRGEMMIGQVLEDVISQHLKGCHSVLISQDGGGLGTMKIMSPDVSAPLVSVNIDQLKSYSMFQRKVFLEYLALGDTKLNCRALILLLKADSNGTDSIGNFLEEIGIHYWPRTRIIGVGSNDHVHEFFFHHSLRNTIHAFYLGYPTPEEEGASNCSKDCTEEVSMYRRCLYCHEGNKGILLINTWRTGRGFEITQDFFPREFEDMMGHQIRVTAKDLFPFVEYELHTQELGTSVTPLDSLDVRMLTTIANHLNFTYETRMPMDDQWGTFEKGKWTGMVGTLQNDQADFSLMLFWSFDRKQVIDFTRIYAYEPFIMITHKPKPTPQHLALVRPFEGNVWLTVVSATMIVGIILWGIQKTWSWYSGGQSVSLDMALLDVLGVILEDPLNKLPTNDAGRLVIGWWMIFSMLVLTVYRSSLVAHLSVPITPPPVDTVEQLLSLEDATWGIEPGFGLGWDWFKLNQNKEVLEMFKTLQVLDLDEQMRRVLKGRHAFFTWKYYIKTIIGSHYTEGQGYTPIHVSREEFIPGSCGWGVRKGAPFLDPMDRIKDKLTEAGLIERWLIKLFETAMWKERMARKNQPDGGVKNKISLSEDTPRDGAVVLNLNHLQGAYYLLFLGNLIALLVLIGESAINLSIKK